MEAGFRHLQVHAAHGYLFSLLIDDRINERAPEVLERLIGWALRYSACDMETLIRISLRTGDPHFDANGRDRFHAQVAKLPFDFIDVSSGFYNIDKQLIYPGDPTSGDAVLKRLLSPTVFLSGISSFLAEHYKSPNTTFREIFTLAYAGT